METHEIQSKTHLSIQYVYLGVTQIIINVIVCILLLHFSLQVPWEKFRKSYLTLKFFASKIAAIGWQCDQQYCFLCIFIFIIVTICHQTICTIVSYNCKLPGFFSYSRIIKTLVLLILTLGFSAFNQSYYRELIGILVGIVVK